MQETSTQAPAGHIRKHIPSKPVTQHLQISNNKEAAPSMAEGFVAIGLLGFVAIVATVGIRRTSWWKRHRHKPGRVLWWTSIFCWLVGLFLLWTEEKLHVKMAPSYAAGAYFWFGILFGVLWFFVKLFYVFGRAAAKGFSDGQSQRIPKT